MKHETVIRKLTAYIDSNYKYLSGYAKDMGFSPAYVTMVLNGTKEPSNYMLHDIGIVKNKVTTYAPIKLIDKG